MKKQTPKEKIAWQRRVDRMPPVARDEVITCGAHRQPVTITNNGRLHVIHPPKLADVWLDAFKTKAEAVKLCRAMGWKVVK